jgi:hypothetical protein
MKLTNVKAMVAKVMTAGLLAGAVALAVPAKADAQPVVIGVRVGYPQYAYGPGYLRFQQERRREEFLRHEAWVRAHEYGRYHNGYGRR